MAHFLCWISAAIASLISCGYGFRSSRRGHGVSGGSLKTAEKDGDWFASILNAASDLILVKGPRAELLWANRAFREYYGLSQEALQELIDSRHSDPDDTVQYVRDDRQVFTTGITLQVIEPITCHDGSVRHFTTAKDAIRRAGADGEIIGTVGISRPLQNEHTIRWSETHQQLRRERLEILRELLDGLPIAALLVDAQHRIVGTSSPFRNIAGSQLQSGENLPTFWQRAVAAAIDAAVEEKRETELSDVEDDEQRLYFDVTVRPWFLTARETGGAMIVVRDVTELRASERNLERANQALEDANQKLLNVNQELELARLQIEERNRELEVLIQSLAAGVVVLDSESRVAVYNKEAERILGVAEGSLHRREWKQASQDLLSSNEAPAPPSPFEQAKLGLSVRDQLYSIDGEGERQTRWVSISEAPFPEKSRFSAVGTLFDVTNRIQIQRELEEFAYIASHDLREPLRMVQSYIGLLDEVYGSELNEEAREFMHFARDAATRMSQLIKELLNFSRTGSVELRPVLCSVEELLGKVLRELSPEIEEGGGQITAQLPLHQIYADPSSLHRILLNLLANALKFRKPGHAPQVRVETEELPHAIRISVRDDGIGLNKRYTQKVFRMFQRLHTREEYEGTGIGLAICKRLVDRHGGMIGVESTLGEGATFWFTLPHSGAKS